MFAYVTFDQSGMIIYHCPDHPWAIGEVTVRGHKAMRRSLGRFQNG